MVSYLVLLRDQLDRTGLFFTSGSELLLLSGYYRYLTKMVQEINLNIVKPTGTTVAAPGSTLTFCAEVLRMVEGARYACDTSSTTQTEGLAGCYFSDLRV